MANATGQFFALRFNGSSTLLNCNNSNIQDGSFTVEAWLNCSNLSAGDDDIAIYQAQDGNTSYGFWLFSNTDFGGANNNLRWFYGTPSTNVELIGSDIRSAGWVHVACVKDGNNFYLYENGSLIDSATVSGINIGTQITKLGNSTLSYYYNGIMCDVRFWNIARSQIDIQNNKDSQLIGNESGLIAYYKLDEGSGATANDSTSNEYDGTISNGNWSIINTKYEWEKVADTLNSQTLKDVIEFNDKIYASTTGGRLFEWNGTNAWVQVASALSSRYPIWGLCVFQDELYGSVGSNGTGGGELYKWNGTDAWVQVASAINSIDNVYVLYEFNSKLYGGTRRPNSTSVSGRLFEWNGTNAWVQVADSLSRNVSQCFTLAELDGVLYGGMGAGSSDSGSIYKWNGTDAWVIVKDTTSGERYLFISVFNEKLYATAVLGTGKLYEVDVTTGTLTQRADTYLNQNYCIRCEGASDVFYAGTSPNGYLFTWNGTDAWEVINSQFESQTELRWSILYSQDNTIYGISNDGGYLLKSISGVLIETNAVTNLASTSVTLNGNVLNDGGYTITERGFAYNTTGLPNITDDTKVTVSGTTGTYSYNLTGLTANTTYYVRAFATNSEGTGYGSVVSFTTTGGGGITAPSTFKITPNIFILDYIGNATATASTTSATLILDDGVEMAEDDFIVNTTNNNTSRRIENEPDAGVYELNANISNQAQDDTIRQYVFTDHTDLVKQETIFFNYRNMGDSELSFTLETTTAYIPRAGQYIRLFLNDDLYFTGKIIDVTRKLHQNGITEKVSCFVRCGSLKVIPSRRTIQVDYDVETTASYIISNLVNDYLVDEGLELGQINDGVNLEEAWLDDMISVGDVLDQLAEKSGYQWFIDKNFALNFYDAPTTVSDCTYSISDSTTSTFTDFRNVTVEETLNNYNNKVFMAGGQDQNGNLVLISQQDTTSILEMQDITAGSGVYGVVDRNSQVQEASYEIAESGTSETAIVIGTVSMVTGDMIYNITKGYKANIIGVDGTTYTLDTTITNQTVDDTIIVYDMANNIARNTLERQKEIPKIITFETFHTGFNPGEKLNIELSTLGISSGDYVIDEVDIQHLATDYFISRVKAILRNSDTFNVQRNPSTREYFKNLGASPKSRTGFGVQRGATNPRVTTSTITPSIPKLGDVFINTSASPSTLYYYNGTAWTT